MLKLISPSFPLGRYPRTVVVRKCKLKKLTIFFGVAFLDNWPPCFKFRVAREQQRPSSNVVFSFDFNKSYRITTGLFSIAIGFKFELTSVVFQCVGRNFAVPKKWTNYLKRKMEISKFRKSLNQIWSRIVKKTKN